MGNLGHGFSRNEALPDRFAPELSALVLLLASRWDSSAAARFSAAAHAGFSWEGFMGWVRRHRVGPMLHCITQLSGELAACLPAAVVAGLAADHRANAIQTIKGIADVRRVGDALAAAGLPVLVVKGLAHSAWFYSDRSARFLKDVDILVPAGRFLEADALLRGAGYRRISPHEDATGEALDEHHYTYHHKAGGILVEMHRRLFRSEHLWPKGFDALYAESRAVPVQPGVEMRALSEPDALLNMCVHGAIHYWARLFWLCDVAEAFVNIEPSVWAEAVREARARGYLGVMCQAAYLAHGLLGVAVPAPLRAVMPGKGAALSGAPLRMIALHDHLHPPLGMKLRMTANRLAIHGSLAYRADTLRYIAATKARGLYRRLFASGSARA